MGSSCAVQLYAHSAWQAEDAAVLGAEEVLRIERKYSRYLSGNTISDINAAASSGGSIAVDAETASLLDFAFTCFKSSNGLFDITSGVLRRAWDFKSMRVPEQDEIDGLLPMVGMHKLVWKRPSLAFTVPGMEIDFGGIVKEYAADCVVQWLRKDGKPHGIVELGGDIAAAGPHPDGTPWVIGVADPSNAARSIRSVSLLQGGIATSGSYRNAIILGGKRYGHLLNPHTGWPVTSLLSVTALGANCMAAGAAATIAMLKDDHGTAWLDASQMACLCIDSAGNYHDTLPRPVERD